MPFTPPRDELRGARIEIAEVMLAKCLHGLACCERRSMNDV
jgi:hypothetical protein